MDNTKLLAVPALVPAGLVLAASGAGLFMSATYARIVPELVAGALAQDLVILLSLPLFMLCLKGALKGAPRD